MRIAPVGLFCRIDNQQGAPAAYTIACESAKTTHGHASSTLASGFFSLVIAHLLRGAALTDAIDTSKQWVVRETESDEVTAAIEAALETAASAATATPETVERLGGGWIAEEALAISLFCALRAKNFERGVRLAVNHGGDSDSTGSLTGQLLGTLWGADAIPSRWLDQVELRDIIEDMARDLVGITGDESDDISRRYPGW